MMIPLLKLNLHQKKIILIFYKKKGLLLKKNSTIKVIQAMTKEQYPAHDDVLVSVLATLMSSPRIRKLFLTSSSRSLMKKRKKNLPPQIKAKFRRTSASKDNSKSDYVFVSRHTKSSKRRSKNTHSS
uniref:Uncharacterized protein n=1 Tax=Cucumis melo TaxID=3656 RepID=A0A9I9EJH8_CUCME